ncbi:hypothetical protein FGG08_005752 [Glutinoglossum americanum]|uniref:Uncharacterized protein n=1 Tax=Glutinoglossum americanum TaxID=1670608 RepID=A0A9P8KVQ2_9PEZI|nr:hypothetical protein FGG08_005752 [Glutinoglossum americanum]
MKVEATLASVLPLLAVAHPQGPPSSFGTAATGLDFGQCPDIELSFDLANAVFKPANNILFPVPSSPNISPVTDAMCSILSSDCQASSAAIAACRAAQASTSGLTGQDAADAWNEALGVSPPPSDLVIQRRQPAQPTSAKGKKQTVAQSASQPAEAAQTTAAASAADQAAAAETTADQLAANQTTAAETTADQLAANQTAAADLAAAQQAGGKKKGGKKGKGKKTGAQSAAATQATAAGSAVDSTAAAAQATAAESAADGSAAATAADQTAAAGAAATQTGGKKGGKKGKGKQNVQSSAAAAATASQSTAAAGAQATGGANFCTGTLTNGKQVKSGSCNPVVMGQIPATDKMLSQLITFPGPGDTSGLKAGKTFTIAVKVANLVAGKFSNAQTEYYSQPQSLINGVIAGHTHVTVQDMGGTFAPKTPLDPRKFAFFKGINDAGDGKGNLQATVQGGLPAGKYRVCTIGSSFTHQPALMPVAQRGAQEDCQKFVVA